VKITPAVVKHTFKENGISFEEAILMMFELFLQEKYNQSVRQVII
jgi:hypothetical protein